MRLAHCTIFLASAISSFAAPVPANALVARDGPLFQKAWTDLGTAYKALDTSFKSLNTALLKPIVSSTVPQSHQRLVDLLQQEANYIGKQNQKLGYAETVALIVPAQTLSNTIIATLKTVESVKQLSVRSGERLQLQQMLKQQADMHSSWESTLNKLVPVGQQTVAHYFGTEASQAYQKALKLYASD